MMKMTASIFKEQGATNPCSRISSRAGGVREADWQPPGRHRHGECPEAVGGVGLGDDVQAKPINRHGFRPGLAEIILSRLTNRRFKAVQYPIEDRAFLLFPSSIHLNSDKAFL
jgi:hypothetical protein